MVFSIKKRLCCICGKKGRVLIFFNRILSKWGHFGTEGFEYWECSKCMKE